ncbi:hypothetical protein N7541_011641 [Penicillium brevicompactum]|uniref:Pyridoxamine 5'-phosphate oxidase Alr4036 family FMN-binding domain-containing protein n=1 Tax=Penicillium brevicompactum TaxID=5074 RepID=A0A9W9UIR1_PENBR|nr:hypothetical protein N7541_011641 [Penicillium brevicompactum]
MSLSTENSRRAPWRDLLDSHLKQTPGYEFTIATIGYDSQQRPVPRLRTCGCRGFFPELELHPKGQEAMDQQVEDGGNPSVFESDMLTFTTDTRMEKLSQLESSGNAIEAVFWLKDLMTQWRIKGTAYAIGNPQGEAAEDERHSRQVVQKALRETKNSDTSKWTWERAVTKYFANHSPVARVSDDDMVDGRPACRPCKLKKKRCTHRAVVESETEVDSELVNEVLPARRRRAPVKEDDVQAQDGSTDELSSIASDLESEKPTPKKRAKRGRPFAPIVPTSLPEIGDLPSNAMEAASALAVHRVFARELESRLQEYDVNFQASQQAHRATITSAKAVKRAVENWIEAWSSGR